MRGRGAAEAPHHPRPHRAGTRRRRERQRQPRGIRRCSPHRHGSQRRTGRRHAAQHACGGAGSAQVHPLGTATYAGTGHPVPDRRVAGSEGYVQAAEGAQPAQAVGAAAAAAGQSRVSRPRWARPGGGQRASERNRDELHRPVESLRGNGHLGHPAPSGTQDRTGEHVIAWAERCTPKGAARARAASSIGETDGRKARTPTEQPPRR